MTRFSKMGLVLMALSLLAWTSWAFAQEAEEPAAEEPAAEEPAAEEPAAEEPAAEGAENTVGMELFNEKCSRCHGEDGQAGTRIAERFELAPFSTDLINTLGADGIAAAITEGRENMRAVTDLTDEQLSALVAYTQSLAQ